jgi:hypothetical protein
MTTPATPENETLSVPDPNSMHWEHYTLEQLQQAVDEKKQQRAEEIRGTIREKHTEITTFMRKKQGEIDELQRELNTLTGSSGPVRRVRRPNITNTAALSAAMTFLKNTKAGANALQISTGININNQKVGKVLQAELKSKTPRIVREGTGPNTVYKLK